jgi:hypothetical protein
VLEVVAGERAVVRLDVQLEVLLQPVELPRPPSPRQPLLVSPSQLLMNTSQLLMNRYLCSGTRGCDHGVMRTSRRGTRGASDRKPAVCVRNSLSTWRRDMQSGRRSRPASTFIFGNTIS